MSFQDTPLAASAVPGPGRWSAVGRRLGLQRNILVMLATILLVGMGEELWLRFLPDYLLLLGAGVGGVAAYGVLKDLLDAAYQYPGGYLSDRLGRRASLALFTLLATGGYLAYLAAPPWGWVLAGTVLVMAWDTLTQPGLFAVIADNLPPERRATGFGVLSVLKRVPTIAAPPLGGLLIAWLGLAGGMQLGLAITIVLSLAAAGVVWRYYADPPRPARHDPVGIWSMWRGMDGRLKRLLASDILARWAEGIPRVFVVLYVINVMGLSAVDFGWLVAIQRTTNNVFYIPLAAMADRMNRKPFVLATFAFFALFPLALLYARGFGGAVVAFVVAGLWEVGEPARKALIVDLARASARGRAIGVYYLLRNLAVFPAAAVGGLLWERYGPASMLWAAFAVGAVGFLVYALWGSADDPRPNASAPGA
jgi:MFS family permease